MQSRGEYVEVLTRILAYLANSRIRRLFYYYLLYGSEWETANEATPDLLGTLEYKMKTREWLYGDNE